ncbi:PPC domain-containing protein [Verrucomicrobiaceae bacterium 5K15]|uniref:PPC domain-containing protein n=1 Tax=Oceaniferula flava TaxID=2800421 RepID=A0AAE2SG05_9BACT|nr:PPC domain-containing protein [Oceaniferula flavus]MBK1856277.1 PPC domain-containing protein [Oceaniferula flavus]MBM1137584.1 PPC domain-containing protein [Oceaniferula flavus]
MIRAALKTLAFLCVSTLSAQAFTPVLNAVLPRGGQRGQEVVVNLHGDRMESPEEIIFLKPGISVTSLTSVNAKQVKAALKISPEAELGEYALRLRCRGGVSYMRTFWVGQFATTKEVEPNNDFGKPQTVPWNTTVAGVAELEDVDYYQVQAKKGQRISVEVEGMRLGGVFFDPYVAILDGKRFELATSDDAPLLRQDAFASIIAPADGNYTILVRESSYEGNNRCRYRLHIGGFTRPSAIYPPAAKPGVATTFTMIGDPAGDYQVTASVTGEEAALFPIFAQKDGLQAPSPNSVLVSSLPFANEKEPNNGSKEVGPTLAAPCAFHGIIQRKNDVDWFRFSAKKGQNLRIQVKARSLRSPLDSVLILRDAKGKQISRNDDQGQLDSIIDFKPSADGDYFLNVRDQLGNGGPAYVYRVEINHRKAALSATLPVAARNNSQLRKAIVIPRGNRYATVVNVARRNTGCECVLEADSLPPGVTMSAGKVPKGVTSFLAFFEAKVDAPLSGGLHHFTIRDANPESRVKGDLNEVVHHIEINNTGTFHSTKDRRVTVAVCEQAPFQVRLKHPPVPIVKNGTAKLYVSLVRDKGFDAPVNVVLPWKPAGVGSPTSITIAKGKTEGVYEINANGDAALGAHRICVTAEATTKSGPVMVASAPVTLQVSEPFLSVSMEMASTTPGQNTSLLCKLNHNRAFSGEAEVILHGLPHGVKTVPKKITAKTRELVFDLEVASDAPKGNHNTIFCQVLPKQGGHVIPHNIGQGGTLRINPPPPKPKGEKAAATTKKPATKKPLSRLEQLRQSKP